MPLPILTIVNRQTGSETERCLYDTRCTLAMDWKLECSVTYCNALRNIPRGLKEVSSRYGTKPFLVFPTRAQRSISTFNIHLQYPPSTVGQYKATKLCPYLCHTHTQTIHTHSLTITLTHTHTPHTPTYTHTPHTHTHTKHTQTHTTHQAHTPQEHTNTHHIYTPHTHNHTNTHMTHKSHTHTHIPNTTHTPHTLHKHTTHTHTQTHHTHTHTHTPRTHTTHTYTPHHTHTRTHARAFLYDHFDNFSTPYTNTNMTLPHTSRFQWH